MTHPGVALLVQDVDALGGAERQALALARALHARGAPVRILTTAPAEALARTERAWQEEREGVVIHRLPLLLFEPLAVGILQQHAREWETLYAAGVMMGAIAVRLGRILSAPVVVKLACSGAWGDIAALNELPPPLRDEVQFDLAQAELICISEDIAREAREAGFAPDHLVRIPNGVEVPREAETPAVLPFGDHTPTILFAGRLDRQKGPDRLLHAFARLKQEAHLLLAGDGPERGRLEAEAAELGVAERVRFLGRRHDVWGLLRGATVCCLPSRAEGLSNTLLEALAAGAPIVASDIPANAEVLQPEGGEPIGLVADADDPPALAAALDRALGDADLRAQLSAAGKARIAGTYAMDVVAERHLELFARLRGTAGPRPGLVRLAGRFALARGHDLRRALTRYLADGTALT